jgi:hypothetical protein
VQRLLKSRPIQLKLAISRPGDIYEREADRVADEVMRMPQPMVQRACAACAAGGSPCPQCETDEELLVHRKAQAGSNGQDSVPDDFLGDLGPGQPLDSTTRSFFEPRFGHDFSHVRVHTGAKASESAAAVNAFAYTIGHHVVLGRDEYSGRGETRKRLLAHELTHVVQQSRGSLSSSAIVQRVPQYTGAESDVVAEREYGGSGAPKAQTCGRPPQCPPGFCDPYRSEKLAEYYRAKKAWWLMAGISAAVDSRVVPLWREYLWGGSSPKNLSADFGKDFTNSPSTKKATNFLYEELKKSLAAKPPPVALYATAVLDIAAQVPKAIAALGDPKSRDQMNFNIPKDIPGNLAGGIGDDQTTCPAGAKPSPFNDERHAGGTVSVTRLSASELTVTPIITYIVKDTIDLCPGDCGTFLESVATVPLSQFEATGISGDVPFTVEFPAPFLGQFTVPVLLTAAPAAPAPAPKKP